MDLPKITEAQFKERLGICAVERTITEMRGIWRETRNTDVGIDGQIEFVDDEGVCTGQIVAAQVKSGASYFLRGDENYIYFKPDPRHCHYWANFPLPVIFFLHNPDTADTFWLDVRRYLRSSSIVSNTTIRIPRENILTFDKRRHLLETIRSSERLLTISEVVKELALEINNSSNITFTFLELFGLGLTDIGRKLFFSTDLYLQVAEAKSELTGHGISIGAVEYNFIGDYIRFLISQNLIYYDLSDFLIDWDDRELVPIILCPLTLRGKAVVDYLHNLRQGLFHERYISIDLMSAPPPFQDITLLINEINSTTS